MRPQRYPRGLDVALDATILLVGLAIFAVSILQWATSGHPVDAVDVGGVALIVVMARYPVVLPQRGGDAVIGFEISALVFLTLTRRPSEALVVWCLGQVISQSFGRRSMRNRLFNVGVTATSGGLFVWIVTMGGAQYGERLRAGPGQPGLRGVLPGRPRRDRRLAGPGVAQVARRPLVLGADAAAGLRRRLDDRLPGRAAPPGPPGLDHRPAARADRHDPGRRAVGQ